MRAGAAVGGGFETADGVAWYRIDDYDLLDPFLVTVVTSDDQWVFVSSSGALTAGRGRAEHALFPYETDDRLHRSGGRSGPITIIRVAGADEPWQPFAPTTPLGRVRRSLAKTVSGDRLRFEEHHPAHGLTFRQTWAPAGRFGLVRRCEVLADEGRRDPIELDLLDGVVDVLPAGVELETQQTSSTLVDAYRRAELDPETGLGLFTLEALITDHADPAEALTANVVWSRGLAGATIALSDRQLRRFRSGHPIEAEHRVTGRKGAYLVSATAAVGPDAPLRWIMAADVDRDHLAVAELRHHLLAGDAVEAEVDRAVAASTAELTAIVAEADGLQQTADRRATVHHFANTLFNCMRGGVFLDDHRVELADVARSVAERNRPARDRFGRATEGLDPIVEITELRAAVAGDDDLVRLVSEYLPLTFSRRHGDPSRPWNSFRIPSRSPGGPPAKGYEGNWRDIFQNWEALVHSFPDYIESVIAKFLNASTMDGHNPYRVTDRGIDWEVPEEGAWGNFGYWGDHQIVYLHRLLLAASRFHPGLLASRLDQCVFSSGDVPYRLRRYDELVADPKHTLVFDQDHQVEIDARVEAIGMDGRLVPAPGTDGGGAIRVHHSTLGQKLLVPALAKLSNLVAGAGIWLNTQRPEWNDANNALVGNGVSTVTVLHLRDYLSFVDDILAGATGTVRIGRPVLDWLHDLQAAFEAHRPAVDVGSAGDAERRALLDRLGRSFERYRSEVDTNGPGAPVPVGVGDLRRFLAAVRPHLDHAATAARRPDGLFHSYWLLDLQPGLARLEPLYEMLEGQAAALAATDSDPVTAGRLVDALFASALYRPDQRSFLLYPDDPPPSFADKNRVADGHVGPTIEALLDAGRGPVRRDVDGAVRFGPELWNARHLGVALDRLERDPELGPLVMAGRAEVEEAYEAVFAHRAFTGRSHTMYAYEGLGSIYWHMVSKVLFALQQQVLAAVDREAQERDRGEREADRDLVPALIERYRRIRSGLGFLKTPAEQGSFPTDPHSHTPAGTGARQPGMTGQVKEGVLIRLGELGVRVVDGRVRFQPVLLDPQEFLTDPRPWPALGPDGVLGPDTLGFTYCGVPVVYHRHAGRPWTRVTWNDGSETEIDGDGLDRDTSRALFGRTGRITRLRVGVTPGRGDPRSVVTDPRR
jgi:hypothetical protein